MTSLEARPGLPPTHDIPDPEAERREIIKKFDETYGKLPPDKLKPEELGDRVRNMLDRATRLSDAVAKLNLRPAFLDGGENGWTMSLRSDYLHLGGGRVQKDGLFVEGIAVGINSDGPHVDHNLNWQRGNTNNERAVRYAENTIDNLFSKTEIALGLNQQPNPAPSTS